jgi:hypothetical protein
VKTLTRPGLIIGGTEASLAWADLAEREGSVHISNLMLQSVFDASKRKKATA